MKIDSREYFEDFINEHLTKENAYNVYIVLADLDGHEFFLFKNCLKLLGTTRKEFFKKFHDVIDVWDGNIADGYTGYTQVAITDKFGTIEYEPHDATNEDDTDITIKNMEVDQTNHEYINFHQELFYSAVREIIENYDEDDFEDFQFLEIVEKIGAFHEKNDDKYTNASLLLFDIRWAMHKHGMQDSFDELGQPTDEFFHKFNTYYDSLSENEQGTLLTLLGRAKDMISIVEKAGHDCL